METKDSERKWAVALKQAAVEDPDIDHENITDLEFVEHAIVAKDHLGKAIKRIKRLQSFKARFGIQSKDGTYSDAMRDLQTFLRVHDGVVGSIGTLEDHSHVLTFHLDNFMSRKMKSEESIALTMRGFYYIFHAMHPNLDAIRAGVTALIDSKGMGWANFSPTVEKEMALLYSHAYPVRINRFVVVNAGIFARLVFHTIIRVFLSSKLVERHSFCGSMHDFLMDDSSSPVYTKNILPVDRWNGKLTLEDLKKTLAERIQERYDNATQFRL